MESYVVLGVSIDTDSATDLSLYAVGNRVLLPGMKWPGCEADNFM